MREGGISEDSVLKISENSINPRKHHQSRCILKLGWLWIHLEVLWNNEFSVSTERWERKWLPKTVHKKTHHVSVHFYERGRNSCLPPQLTSLQLLCLTPYEGVSVTYIKKIQGYTGHSSEYKGPHYHPSTCEPYRFREETRKNISKKISLGCRQVPDATVFERIRNMVVLQVFKSYLHFLKMFVPSATLLQYAERIIRIK